MAGIVWLASYPKSGNTWVRVFLTNYQRNTDVPADINALDGGPIAADRRLFDDVAGVEAADLSPAAVAAARPAVFRLLADASTQTQFLKIHDAYRAPGGVPVIPADATRAVVYVVRNPLDVAVSFANHEGLALEESVARLCQDVTVARSVGRLRLQLEQRLLTWGQHALSWVDQTDVPCCVVRYEDLLQTPDTAFRRILDAVGLPVEADRLARAIAFSSFDRLRGQEARAGFRERPASSPVFFREGRSGGWRGRLDEEQVSRIIAANHDVMSRFSYLPSGVGDGLEQR